MVGSFKQTLAAAALTAATLGPTENANAEEYKNLKNDKDENKIENVAPSSEPINEEEAYIYEDFLNAQQYDDLNNKSVDKNEVEKERNIEYQVDTVKHSNYMAAYKVDRNIMMSTHIEDKENREVEKFDPIFTHEQKHKDDAYNGVDDKVKTYEQNYKTTMHKEIGASIAELLALRQQIIENGGDVSIVTENPTYSKMFSSYAEAIKNGTIDLNSADPHKFDEEMSFIANSVRNNWIKTNGDNYAKDAMNSSVIHRDSDNNAPEEHYDESSMKIYNENMGGVDFLKYFDKDIEIPEKNKKTLAEVATMREKNPYKGDIDVKQWSNLNSYALISDDLEKALSQYSEDEIKKLSKEQLNEMFFDAVAKTNGPMSDKDARRLDVANTLRDLKSLPDADDKLYDKKVNDMLTVKGINFSKMLNDDIISEIEGTTNLSCASSLYYELEENKNKGNIAASLNERLGVDDTLSSEKASREPEYYEWSEETRVSSPQKAEILNLKDETLVQHLAVDDNKVQTTAEDIPDGKKIKELRNGRSVEMQVNDANRPKQKNTKEPLTPEQQKMIDNTKDGFSL